ncbi:hypothetical protein RN22_03355 [Grimontia sp. AD028]|uniref:hypothetical protein n=1 Tax=Grimontia sp. AD028 TaxID=1581149 RepID=UPI00061AC8DC|nr:hypothetical protein [Grimontia sp. AD028]KKD61952.1 hypothetical protein RN22_03355 [Grimontia sp. AD028]
MEHSHFATLTQTQTHKWQPSMRTFLCATLMVFTLAACSADVGREMAEDDCYQIRNNADRKQCLEEVDRTFKNYP